MFVSNQVYLFGNTDVLNNCRRNSHLASDSIFAFDFSIFLKNKATISNLINFFSFLDIVFTCHLIDRIDGIIKFIV